MKLSLGPNHKFLCPSSWDFIEKSTNFAVLTSVKTSLLTLIARTAWRTNCWPTYFNRNHHKPSWKKKHLRADLLIYFSTMPRTDRTITRLSQLLQTGTQPRSGTVSTLRNSQTKFYSKPESSTTKVWTLYRCQACHEYHLSNSRRWKPHNYQNCSQELSPCRILPQRRISTHYDRKICTFWSSNWHHLRAFYGTTHPGFE